MSARDHGAVSAFVVIMTLAVVMCAALVIDGGRGVANQVHAADHAENAARAGAQELVGLRAGAPRIEPERARAAALSYLSAHGVSGEVDASESQVTVTVELSVSTVLLHLAGVSTLHARATRTARPVTS